MNFQVELTSYCDLTCGYCPNRDMERERVFMSDDVWETILLSYIVPYKNVNSFSPPTFIGHKDGEPLLNRQLPARLKRLADVASDMTIDIYSHGLMLPRWRDRGLDFFDFLSTLPNRVRYMMSYHPRNHDHTVNDYKGTVRYLKEVLTHNRPLNVEFITVSHRSPWVSQDMQDDWSNTWKGFPITVHCNTDINPWTGLMEEIATCHYNGCPYSDFGHWFFGATGNVIACCLDLEEEIVLGNVLRDDPAEMFARTEAFYAEQRRIKEENKPVAYRVCANCFDQDKQPELVSLGVLGV